MYHCECSAEGCGLRHLRVLIDVGMVVKPVVLDEWRDELEQVQDRLGALFVRPEPRKQAGLYLEALLSSAERKNGWQMAEQIGDPRPWRTQRVLSHALWSQDKARALCRDYVIEHLGSPDGVLIVDETGFLKKGTQSVGVARQYSGTAGRIENCQIGVFLSYGSSKGHALIDRELYLPQAWTNDRQRCDAVSVPPERAFLTKPQLAQLMIERAIAARVPFSWVAGDEVYGNDRRLRLWLEQQERPYVLAVRSTETLGAQLAEQEPWANCGQGSGDDRAGGRLAASERRGRQQRRAAVRLGALAAVPPAGAAVGPVAAGAQQFSFFRIETEGVSVLGLVARRVATNRGAHGGRALGSVMARSRICQSGKMM